MNTLLFPAAEVRRLLEHTLAAKSFRQGYEESFSGKPARPALWLVGDRGVYLMSNADPADMVSGSSIFVSYAKGYNPSVDPDWYDAKRETFGGDDFVDTLPWLDRLANDLDKNPDFIHLKANRNTIVYVGALKAPVVAIEG